jgi:hypothetical protein
VGTITTAICTEVESLNVTSFDSRLCNSVALKMFAKSFTSLSFAGLSGMPWAKPKPESKRAINKRKVVVCKNRYFIGEV